MENKKSESIRVFRFFEEKHALEILRTGLWKIGRLTELNDPFDCQPILTNHPNADDINRFTTEYFRQFNDVIGVICYSSKIDDPVIWSHYADSHRGIALAFDYTEVNFKSILQINYQDDRPQLDYAELEELKAQGDFEQLKKVIQKGFTTKATSWKYEDEYRHFIFLDADDNQIIGRHYFRPISKYEIHSVILGEKCTLSIQDVSRLIKKSEFHHIRINTYSNGIPREDVRVIRAKMSHNKYKMQVEL